MTPPFAESGSMSGYHLNEQLRAHMDHLPDEVVPELRFDMAGLPSAAQGDALTPRLWAAQGLPPVEAHTGWMLDSKDGEWHDETVGTAGSGATA